MKKKQLRKSIRQYTRDIEKLAGKVAPDFQPEAIHKFRVRVKKLRAVLSLVARTRREAEMKLPRSFKELYHAAGDIRDAQVMLEKISSLPEPVPGVAVWLANRIAAAEHRWLSLYRPSIPRKLRKEAAAVKVGRLDVITLCRFFREQLTVACRTGREKAPADEALHATRKEIKDLQYITALVQKEWPAGYAALQRFAPEKIDELSQKAGDYNDRRNALEYLADYRKAVPAGDAGKAALNALAQAWQQERQSERRQLQEAMVRLTPDCDPEAQ